MFTVFLIFLAVCAPMLIGIWISRYLKYKAHVNRELQVLQQQIQDNSLPELRQEVSALKKRVVTLEAIVTSHGYELNEKISNL
ncbi:hypothetical protein theurythT_17990 [Thalassotalea eurytherma]|uniref:Phage shock protein B n=2 Tax=Thalassotalea eurytherma TaxID=1144278 RepID=A0ABQ6H2K9_9GAMM|nr:hypothetical protein theurythT_17990 [Thalassotalea eurytherma]